jgi:hypothetical protein
MAQLGKGRARLRAVDPPYCKHPKLIPIWKYKRFPTRHSANASCGREMVTARLVSSTTVTPVRVLQGCAYESTCEDGSRRPIPDLTTTFFSFFATSSEEPLRYCVEGS